MTGVDEVRIVPWTRGDRALLDVLLGDPKMMEHLGGPETTAKLDQRQSRYELPDSRQYKILVDGKPAGWLGYWDREWHNEPVWETGWSVAPAFQGRGVASSAMRLLLDVIAVESDVRAVHAFPSVDNAPSNGVCRKVGFELRGAVDIEYPPGHPLRCNDWVLDLQVRPTRDIQG